MEELIRLNMALGRAFRAAARRVEGAALRDVLADSGIGCEARGRELARLDGAAPGDSSEQTGNGNGNGSAMPPCRLGRWLAARDDAVSAAETQELLAIAVDAQERLRDAYVDCLERAADAAEAGATVTLRDHVARVDTSLDRLRGIGWVVSSAR